MSNLIEFCSILKLGVKFNIHFFFFFLALTFVRLFNLYFVKEKSQNKEKKGIYFWIADFTKGSVSFQAISHSDSFLAISVQLQTVKIMWDDSKDS